MAPLRALLVVLAKPKDRISVREKIAQDLKELLPVFAKEKTGMEITVDATTLFWGHPDSYQRVLQVLKNWFPGYDQYLVIGHWTVGRNWLGVYEGQICYGYGYIHSYWTWFNKGIGHALSHEMLHWLLNKKGVPSSIWVNRVHQFDQKGDKNYWNKLPGVGWKQVTTLSRRAKYMAKYITLAGFYEK